MKKEVVMSSKAPEAIGPYSHGIKCGNMFFISGQLPMENGELKKDIKEQTEACIKNLSYIVEEAGGSLDNIVKTTVFLSDMAYFQEMNEVYAKYFSKNSPARSAIAVKTLPKNVDVEIEAIAMLD